MAKSEEDCIKEVRRVLVSMTNLIGKPYVEAKEEFKAIQKDGRTAITTCNKNMKSLYEESSDKIWKLIDTTQNQTLISAETLQQSAKAIVDEAVKKFSKWERQPALADLVSVVSI